MNVFRIEVSESPTAGSGGDSGLLRQFRDHGAIGVERIAASRIYFVEGEIGRTEAERIAGHLLVDPVTETAHVAAKDDEVPMPTGHLAFEIHLRPGVMDPVAESTLAELRAEGYRAAVVRTARRFTLFGTTDSRTIASAARRMLLNDCIEEMVIGTAGVRPARKPPDYSARIRSIAMRDLDAAALESLSRRGHLFLSLTEMQTIQAHYRGLGRDPTDLELETLAQTWSEHCVHKTLKSAVVYRGAALPAAGHARSDASEIRYANLLKDTIGRATEELIRDGRGPKCLSVFKDNAGVIAFDDQFGVAFKVETHNRPSAIEPFGGAATGIGGCIRDVLGCGLGARPIANTDVFCVAPGDWPQDALPKGVLHPRRVLRGVVDGVGEYGNRMGIPTVNGAVHFDPRYLGNPLVFAGCVGIIPRNRIEKAARDGDLILLIGGRTGRDGIHGATFSSAELTDTHADEFSHAVQIGNAIEEKRVLDAVIRARDHASGCLYTAITDCGAGGLSSAIGEMGEKVGATVDLEKVPLKYAGLRYDEIWISEAQERMVLAIAPDNLAAFMVIAREEDVEATVIGEFGVSSAERGVGTNSSGPQLVVRYEGTVVGDMEMHFLHHGLPKPERVAEWQPGLMLSDNPKSNPGAVGRQSRTQNQKSPASETSISDRLLAALSDPTAASKEWIIRRYDHEVQGASVIKPLMGPGAGPADAAVLRPRLDSTRGIAVGCGLAPQLSDIDPYWMAIAAIDEALCNVVAVGGDPRQTAMLDNFCWGRTDDPRQMGALVRACQACYDAAKAFGVPFISGKDSLNNEFVLDKSDIEPLIAQIRQRFADPSALGYPAGVNADAIAGVIESRIRETGRVSIPPTLLISAISLVEDVRQCMTPDLKTDGGVLYRVGGLPVTGFDLAAADCVRIAIHDAIRDRLVTAVHDGTSGWLPALAEMAIAGDRGAEITEAAPYAFEPACAAFVVETSAATSDALESRLQKTGVAFARIGSSAASRLLVIGGRSIEVAALREAWRGG